MIFVSSRAWAFLASWYSAFSFRSPKPRAVLISSAIAARAGPSSSASASAQRLEVGRGHLVVEIVHGEEPSDLDPIQRPDAERNRHSGRDRRRSGARGAGRHGGARGRRPQGDPRRPGARGVARRTGVLVARRADARRQPRAAAPADPRLARARVAGLARHRRLRPPGGRVAAQVGRGLRRLRRGREARVAGRAGRQVHAERGVGRARRLPRHRATATPCRASTSPGAPAPACWSRSSGACAPRRSAAGSSCASATRSTR